MTSPAFKEFPVGKPRKVFNSFEIISSKAPSPDFNLTHWPSHRPFSPSLQMSLHLILSPWGLRFSGLLSGFPNILGSPYFWSYPFRQTIFRNTSPMSSLQTAHMIETFGKPFICGPRYHLCAVLTVRLNRNKSMRYSYQFHLQPSCSSTWDLTSKPNESIFSRLFAFENFDTLQYPNNRRKTGKVWEVQLMIPGVEFSKKRKNKYLGLTLTMQMSLY